MDTVARELFGQGQTYYRKYHLKFLRRNLFYELYPTTGAFIVTYLKVKLISLQTFGRNGLLNVYREYYRRFVFRVFLWYNKYTFI